MAYRPMTPVNNCPHCNDIPIVKYRLFKGYRAECSCGVCGPYVKKPKTNKETLTRISDGPERIALILWESVAGKYPRPKPPANIFKNY